jgi:hypothetical protein
MLNLFDTPAPTRKRRSETENRSETLVIASIVVLMNDDQIYIRRDMNADCDLQTLLDTMYQIRRTVQIGNKQRQHMAIFIDDVMVSMFYAPDFDRDTVRIILMERLYAQTG